MPSLLYGNSKKQLRTENVNKSLIQDHSVEELISQKLSDVKQELLQGEIKQFKDVIDARFGDSSACGLCPITFIRQVTALTCCPELLDSSIFPNDVKNRAISFIQSSRRISSGLLADPGGLEIVREDIAKFVALKDNCPADSRDIFIVPGLPIAIKMVSNLLKLFSNGRPVAIMTPIPQFPALNAGFLESGLQCIDYYLNEENSWSIDVEDMDQAFAGQAHCKPRAILVVNPGYPTGHILPRTNMEDLLKFAEREKLAIVAFEIYQSIVYDEYEFFSFKKVAYEMGAPYNAVELVSIMLFAGDLTEEPGLQSGFIEMFNIDQHSKSALIDMWMSSDLTPLYSQIALDCLVNPPKPGDPSYLIFFNETRTFSTYAGVLAKTVHNRINSIKGLSCWPIMAGFSAFVKVDIPQRACDEAKSLKLCPSTFYVLKMLQQCGVIAQPGEIYGEKLESHHFMISILLPEEKLKKVLQWLQEFHCSFLGLYQ